MSIRNLLKKEVSPADVQGAFEDLVNDLTNPEHAKSPDAPAVMMRFLAILENASDDTRAYLIEKAGEYTFLQTAEFKSALNAYRSKAIAEGAQS